MNLFRKIIFWCHLSMGVTGGIIILLMSVTGVLLTYERQMLVWADTRNYPITPPSASAARLPIETLLAKVKEAQPTAKITNLTAYASPAKPVAVALTQNPGGNRTVFVNPYTGVVLGEGSQGMRQFFRLITDWHRWVGVGGPNRTLARAVTGACNLAFLFIVVSGIYLWWPRQWSRLYLRNIAWFRRGLPGKARDFNWHNVIGLWSSIPLFIVVLSAVPISYQWAGNLVFRLAGETPPTQRGPGGPAPGNPPPPRKEPDPATPANPLAGLNDSWARAEQHTLGWQTLSLRVPDNATAPAVFTIDQGSGGQPQKRATLTLDRQTGNVVRYEPFSSLTKGRQWRSYLRFAHTGEVIGLLGQTIAGLVSLGGAFLVWTGLALTWRRFRAWQARRVVKRVELAQDQV